MIIFKMVKRIHFSNQMLIIHKLMIIIILEMLIKMDTLYIEDIYKC